MNKRFIGAPAVGGHRIVLPSGEKKLAPSPLLHGCCTTFDLQIFHDGGDMGTVCIRKLASVRGYTRL